MVEQINAHKKMGLHSFIIKSDNMLLLDLCMDFLPNVIAIHALTTMPPAVGGAVKSTGLFENPTHAARRQRPVNSNHGAHDANRNYRRAKSALLPI